MTRTRFAAVLGVVAALTFAPSALAAPSPDTNKNALLVEFDCGTTSFVGATILQNAAAAAQIVDDDGAVIQIVTLWSYSNGERTEGEELRFTTPGFDHNGAATLTCDWWNALYPDLYWRGEMVIHPGD
ncbi:MAG: hypothetical protein AB1736_05555 [Chloroflexota bacterium]